MSSKLKAEALRSMTEEQRKATLIDQARLLMDLKVQRATDRLEATNRFDGDPVHEIETVGTAFTHGWRPPYPKR